MGAEEAWTMCPKEGQCIQRRANEAIGSWLRTHEGKFSAVITRPLVDEMPSEGDDPMILSVVVHRQKVA